MLGDRNFWGKGMSTDILRAISIYAFDTLKARKLSAGAYSLNVAVAFGIVGFRLRERWKQRVA